MDCDLLFSVSSSADTGSFKLLELPQELYDLVCNSHDSLRFTIKGVDGEDDAVLTTNDKTYSMRAIVLSNSVLVIAPPVDADYADNQLVIRDQVREIIEIAPIVPKLHKLKTLLRGREYSESDESMEEDQPGSSLTYLDAQRVIQASNAEIDRGLKELRVLNINNQLRLVAPEYLQNILELMLTLLVSQSHSLEAVHVEPLTSTLVKDYDIPRTVAVQIMEWFGDIHDGRWKVNSQDIMKQIGLTTLQSYKDNPITVDDFLKTWRKAVGDTFESFVSLDLLLGNYLSRDDTQELSYFPVSALPTDPAARFNDLFLTRSRWKHEDVVPFLTDIAVSSKERDKLLLKYARTTTDSQGVWYTARVQYNS